CFFRRNTVECGSGLAREEALNSNTPPKSSVCKSLSPQVALIEVSLGKVLSTARQTPLPQ
ncbi:hypothetical protein ACW9H7_19155, partial [Pseudomonas yamanorum]